jgi:hypothetical protein
MVVECAQCGAAITEGQVVCASCGVEAAPSASVLAGEEISRFLAEANLLRIRKQADDAIGVCTRVLRLDPANATAHSLMGDIYRDGDNYREALGWYKLAVQLDSTNIADRKKLDEMIDQVFRNDRHAADEQEPSEETADNGALSSSFRSLLEKISPVHVIIAFTVLAVVAFFILMGVPMHSRHRTSAHNQPTTTMPTPVSSTVTSGTTDTQPPVGATPPAPDMTETGGAMKIPGIPATVTPNGAAKPSAPNASGTGSTDAKPGAGAVQQVPPFEPQSRPTMTAEDLQNKTARLKSDLQAMLKSSKLPSTLDDVTIDPYTYAATISYTIPPLEGGLAEMKQGLLYTGFNLIWTAEKTDSSIHSYLLRGYTNVTEGEESKLALRAEISPEQADQARDAGDYRAVEKYMTNVWWRGDLDAVQL